MVSLQATKTTIDRILVGAGLIVALGSVPARADSEVACNPSW